MRLVVLLVFVLSFAAEAAELKNLGPENVSLSRRLLKMLGPESSQEVPSQVNEKESLNLSHRGNSRLPNPKGSESHMTNR